MSAIGKARSLSDYRQKGFTLIELLVVMAILVMIALAVPSLYSRTHQAMLLKTTTASLAQSLRALQRQAMTQGRVHQWAIADGANAYRINHQPAIPLDSTALHLRFEPLSAKEMISSRPLCQDSCRMSDEQAVIRFFPDGSATGGRLSVASGQRSRGITIDWLTGRVHVDE